MMCRIDQRLFLSHSIRGNIGLPIMPIMQSVSLHTCSQLYQLFLFELKKNQDLHSMLTLMRLFFLLEIKASKVMRKSQLILLPY